MATMTSPIDQVLELSAQGRPIPQLLLRAARQERARQSPNDVDAHPEFVEAFGSLFRHMERIVQSLSEQGVIAAMSTDAVDAMIRCRALLTQYRYEPVKTQSGPVFMYKRVRV